MGLIGRKRIGELILSGLPHNTACGIWLSPEEWIKMVVDKLGVATMPATEIAASLANTGTEMGTNEK